MSEGRADPARLGVGAPDVEPAANRPLLRLASIARQHANGVRALDDLSLDVGTHEIVGIVGPSGSGKSTALRIVAGLDHATAGSVIWADGAAPTIGFVFQEPALMPWATTADNVYLPLRLRGMRRADAEPLIDEALAGVGLRSFAQAHPRQLSGGMRMRVSVARALVTRPRLLLMDEPFAALDEMSRGRLNDDLLALAAEHRLAMAFVTHSIYEAAYLCDRVLVMTPGPGRIAAEIAIDQARPRSETFRTSARYGELCAEIGRALRATGALTSHGPL